MYIKKFLIAFLTFIFIFAEVPKADQMPTATTLKQGIYNISDEHEGLYRNIKLTTPDKGVTLTILDSNCTQKLFIKLHNTNEYLKVGPIEKGETLIVTGEGEISVIH